MYSPETHARIEQLRLKPTLTLEEMQEAVALMRGDRLNAAFTAEGSRRKKAKAAVKSADDLLRELEDLP